MSLLITNIKSLVNVRTENRLLCGKALRELAGIEGAFLLINEGRIDSFGPMGELVHATSHYDQVYDASGKFVLPCWCDSHTPLVFAGSREGEFVDKIEGLSYA